MAARDDVMTHGRGHFALAMFALSLSMGCGGADASGSGGSGGNGPVTGATSGGSKQSSSATKAAANATSSGSGSSFVCDPPAAPGSLYENAATQLVDVDPTSMCEYRGDVLLIVDTAAE